MTNESLKAAPIAIGWAHETITPDKPVQLQGQMHERVSTHVNDPCTATALAIESQPSGSGDREQAIIISCDIVYFETPLLQQLRQRVAAKAPDFDGDKLMVCCTHPHTSPVIVDDLYKEPDEGVMHPNDTAAFLLDQLEKAALTAWQNRKPGSISRGVGQAAIGFNRRVVYKDGSAKMYGKVDTPDFKEIEGASDPTIEMLFTYNEAGDLTGIAACPACPAQVVEGKSFVSADFWGVARTLVAEHFGKGVHLLGLTGAAGDQSPRDLVRMKRSAINFRDLDGMHELGKRLANAIIDAHDNHQTTPQREMVFCHEHALLDLPMRIATKAEADEAQQQLDELLAKEPDALTSAGPSNRWGHRYLRAINRYKQQDDDPRFQADVHFIRLGDVAFATNPFELFLDYGFQIKGRSPAMQTFVVQLTNERGMYLPTEKAVRGGSYSAMIYDNNCGPEGGAKLVEDTLAALGQFWPGDE